MSSRTSSRVLTAAAHELPAGDDDHVLVLDALYPQCAPVPRHPGLAALVTELRRLRCQEPDAPAVALLVDAADRHPRAVALHLAWVSQGRTRSPAPPEARRQAPPRPSAVGRRVPEPV